MMAFTAKDRTTPSAPRDYRGFTQVLFVSAGMLIIVGGLWTLYMGDAPYHPNEVSQFDGGMTTSVVE